MSDTALTVRENVDIEAYGNLAEIREMTRRLMAMLPSARDLGPGGAGALAQASLAMGLNPFIGQIWAIPQGSRNKDGTFDTYGIMVGISGLRSKAHEQARDDGGMYTVHYRIPREGETEGLQINQGDIARACDLTLSTNSARRHFEFTGEVPRYTGIGVYRKGERTKMNPLQVARKRAEAEAIKQAFDVPLSFSYGAAPVSGDVEIEDMPERYQEHGDGLVNGNAHQAAAELFEDYVDAETVSVSEGGLHGAPMDAGAREDYREVLTDEELKDAAAHIGIIDENGNVKQREDTDLEAELPSKPTALDYVPDWLDNEETRPGMWWGKFDHEATTHLGFKNDFHVHGALAKVYGLDKWISREQTTGERSYREAWHLLQEHVRSKEAE